MFDVRNDDLTGEQTRDLLAMHLAGMHANSPSGSVFALDLSGLQTPDVTVWTAWSEGRIAAIGALKMLPDGIAEVKSMRTHPDFLRMGAGAAILETIITEAKVKGARRISLETGDRSSVRSCSLSVPATRLFERQRICRVRAEQLQPVSASRSLCLKVRFCSIDQREGKIWQY